jgi:tripartite-type tricarboxylate transporter receptor subunit TctC
LQLRTGIKLQMVPYSANSAQAISDVHAGRIPIMIDGFTGLMPSFQSGNLDSTLHASGDDAVAANLR